MKKVTRVSIASALVCVVLTSCARTMGTGESAYTSVEIPYDTIIDADQDGSSTPQSASPKTTKTRKTRKTRRTKKTTTTTPKSANAKENEPRTTTAKQTAGLFTSTKEDTRTTNTTKTESPVEPDSSVEPDDIPAIDADGFVYDENGLKYALRDGSLWLAGRGNCTQTDIVVLSRVGGKPVIGVFSSAFSGDATIESVTFSEGITSIGSGAFLKCKKLKTVNFPSTLKKIDMSAFHSAPITSMVLPDGLEYIGKAAFLRIQMKRLSIPDSVKTIEKSAFKLSALEEVSIPAGATLGTGIFHKCSALKTVTLPDGLTDIPSQTFEGCTSLTTLNLPDSIVNVGDRAFSECKKLVIKQLTLRHNCGSDAFSNTRLQNVDIYANQLNRSFMHASIQNLTIHEGVTTIGKDVFTNAVIKQLSLPSTLSTVDGYAFYGSYVDEVVFTGPVTLGHSAFMRSTIKSITLPAGSRLQHYVFDDCEKLETIRYGGTMQEWHSMMQMPAYSFNIQDYNELYKAATIICSDGTI